MIRNFMFCIALLAILFPAAGSVSAFGEKDDGKVKGKTQDSRVFVQVIVYDIVPGKDSEFEAAIQKANRELVKSPDFINERLLKNVDELASQYASYTKFANRRLAESFVQERLAAVKNICSRTPETHLAEMTVSYYGREGHTKNPTGMEYGSERIGQVAHIGFFIPFPKYRELYESTLDEVKQTIQRRNPIGYMGEDVLVETEVVSPEKQTPFTPRATVLSQMSINYGEYDTFENAEDSYIARNEPRNDPKITALQRNFFSALQVPTRFYIFKVIANTNGTKRDSMKTALAIKGKAK